MVEMIATRDAYGNALTELGTAHQDVVVLDADLSGSTKTGKFAKKFPERFFNMGISEQDLVGTAVGLAISGKVPFASTFAVFESGRAWEQIRQSVCYPFSNVKLVASHGGITVGEDGASHQSVEDIALMRVLPNMTVIIPADAEEMRQVINVVYDYHGPVYVRAGRNKTPIIYGKDYQFKIGKAVVHHIGKDVNIIAAGIMVYFSLQAAEELKKEGIDAGVINMSTIKPIDKEAILKAAEASRAIITAEEHSVIGGLGSAVAEVLVENLPVPMMRVGIQDRFGTSGKPEELLKHFGLTAEDIKKAAKEVIKKKR